MNMLVSDQYLFNMYVCVDSQLTQIFSVTAMHDCA